MKVTHILCPAFEIYKLRDQFNSFSCLHVSLAVCKQFQNVNILLSIFFEANFLLIFENVKKNET